MQINHTAIPSVMPFAGPGKQEFLLRLSLGARRQAGSGEDTGGRGAGARQAPVGKSQDVELS